MPDLEFDAVDLGPDAPIEEGLGPAFEAAVFDRVDGRRLGHRQQHLTATTAPRQRPLRVAGGVGRQPLASTARSGVATLSIL
ncbi:hypothetical protein [Aquibium microcysteis]|uniref:hypothetical protein n=1 Tax=Aquibium microcysteis TaxID=675281 RepID=UPI00165D14A9|nr:hypothetical protein [Aquibium microcysteis]